MTKLIFAFRKFANEPIKSKAVFGVVKFEPVKQILSLQKHDNELKKYVELAYYLT